MAIFNVNQNRQFYVLKNIQETEDITITNNVGDWEVITIGDSCNPERVFFKHVGLGGLTRSDIIDCDKISYWNFTRAESMRRYPKKANVKLNTDYTDQGNPISGQDYILRIQINNYLAPGDASVLIKVGAVHATKTMTAQQFYEAMATSLTKAFSREPQPLLTFKGSATGLEITEVVDQPWRRGVLSQEPVNFEVYASTIRFDSEEVIWAELDDKGYIPVKEDTTGTAVGNGKKIADLEYFCMAERGDMFRNMGWPNNIDVQYMVDPTKEYDVLNIHYDYSGDGVQVHKSEKDITVVMDHSLDSDGYDTMRFFMERLGLVQEPN